MGALNIWTILGVISAVLLIVYWGNRNAVWGGLTIGIIIGLAISLFSGFDLSVVGKGAVVGTMLGFVAELLGKISDKIRNSE